MFLGDFCFRTLFPASCYSFINYFIYPFIYVCLFVLECNLFALISNISIFTFNMALDPECFWNESPSIVLLREPLTVACGCVHLPAGRHFKIVFTQSG